MKTYFLVTTLLILFVSTESSAVETRFLQGLGDTRYHHVESAEIGRAFHIFVMLPVGYEDAEQSIPTLYLLDGGALFPMFSSYYRYLKFGEEAPEMIIVGISYGDANFEGGNFRSTDYTAPSAERDYWGGAEKFQQFMSDELMPMIESTYRSRADRRMIFGQSLGGQFVLYTAQTKPSLFWGHIASNPALHRNLDFFLQSHASSGNELRSHLFVGSATNDDRRFRVPALRWIDYWSNRKDKPWRLQTVDLQGHNHMSAPPASFRQGLRWLFSDD